MNTLTITLYILAGSIIVAFVAGVITRNYSHVDRLWSILPAVYVLVWMRDFSSNPRFLIPAVLVILWAVRLTGNFAVKGGYNFSFRKGFYEEDYRWAVLRKKIPNRVVFELFNLSFISFYQLALVFGFTLPLYYLGSITGPVTGLEIMLYGLHASLLLVETIADMQQLSYYRKRGKEAHRGNPRVQLGFNTYGLWKHSRHPNYVCEIGQWIVVYLYLLVAGASIHPSGLGAVLLTLLFVGSTIMAENITTAKYPAYKDWKKATPPWIPFLDWPFRRRHREAFSQQYHLADF